jgi:hypothetical protein
LKLQGKFVIQIGPGAVRPACSTREVGGSMPMSRCEHCGLPTRIHFAWCQESGARGVIPPEALRPGAIVSDTREWRWLKPVAWNKGRR